ncbi:MAG TPA: L,D-transpeptidase [Longimicrobiales bacterium]|nr:L,D-transpeptidase [Longimicrobiales bacterium]
MTRKRHWIRRALLGGFLVLATLSAGAAVLLRANPDRRDDPSELVEEAAVALRAARSEGAVARAPMTMAQAEDLYAHGLLERRRQELRFVLLRDFRPSHAAFQASLEKATTAATLAQRSARRDRTRAARVLASADAAVMALVGTEDRIWMAPPVRLRLQRARSMLQEARTFLDHDQFEDAIARALAAEAEAEHVGTSLHAATSRFSDDERLRTWRGWVAETVAWSRTTGKTAIVVDKDAHLLTVYQGGRVVREYDAELGWNNVGDKLHQGDGATPEGRYKITDKKSRGRSRYHKALLLDFPNRDDLRELEALKASGEIPRGTRAGSLIEIHGEGGKGKDWTDGCVAITNDQIDWIFARVAVGTPVTIVGSQHGEGLFSDVARRLAR